MPRVTPSDCCGIVGPAFGDVRPEAAVLNPLPAPISAAGDVLKPPLGIGTPVIGSTAPPPSK